MKTQKWFEKKIGKRIYRDPDTCGCSTCEDVVENGLVVADKNHAEYLYMIQGEFKLDGIDLNYRDNQLNK